MEWYQILALIGIPGVITAVLNYLERKMIRKETVVSKVKEKTDALALGVQALLRAQMITDYFRYSEMGGAPIEARENFENVWKQYKALGCNGVMDDLHTKFMALPVKKEGTA